MRGGVCWPVARHALFKERPITHLGDELFSIDCAELRARSGTYWSANKVDSAGSCGAVRIRVEVHASEATVEIFVEADFEDLPEERRRFAILSIPRHQYGEGTGAAARRAAKSSGVTASGSVAGSRRRCDGS